MISYRSLMMMVVHEACTLIGSLTDPSFFFLQRDVVGGFSCEGVCLNGGYELQPYPWLAPADKNDPFT
jgi:hypothetical protein